jgi:hypothetical protein
MRMDAWAMNFANDWQQLTLDQRAASRGGTRPGVRRRFPRGLRRAQLSLAIALQQLGLIASRPSPSAAIFS